MRQWRHLQLLKRAGCEHKRGSVKATGSGELCTSCPSGGRGPMAEGSSHVAHYTRSDLDRRELRQRNSGRALVQVVRSLTEVQHETGDQDACETVDASSALRYCGRWGRHIRVNERRHWVVHLSELCQDKQT